MEEGILKEFGVNQLLKKRGAGAKKARGVAILL